jgi:hypothetical protein
MPLFDKVKEQAAQAAQKAQEAAQKGQAKLDEAQAKRREDALLRDLGAVVYAERTGTAGADSAGDIERLVADISAHRAENAATASASTTAAAPEGDFTLD